MISLDARVHADCDLRSPRSPRSRSRAAPAPAGLASLDERRDSMPSLERRARAAAPAAPVRPGVVAAGAPVVAAAVGRCALAPSSHVIFGVSMFFCSAARGVASRTDRPRRATGSCPSRSSSSSPAGSTVRLGVVDSHRRPRIGLAMTSARAQPIKVAFNVADLRDRGRAALVAPAAARRRRPSHGYARLALCPSSSAERSSSSRTSQRLLRRHRARHGDPAMQPIFRTTTCSQSGPIFAIWSSSRRRP